MESEHETSCEVITTTTFTVKLTEEEAEHIRNMVQMPCEMEGKPAHKAYTALIDALTLPDDCIDKKNPTTDEVLEKGYF